MLAEMFNLETIDGNNLFKKKKKKRREKESKRKIKNHRMVLSW